MVFGKLGKITGLNKVLEKTGLDNVVNIVATPLQSVLNVVNDATGIEKVTENIKKQVFDDVLGIDSSPKSHQQNHNNDYNQQLAELEAARKTAEERLRQLEILRQENERNKQALEDLEKIQQEENEQRELVALLSKQLEDLKSIIASSEATLSSTNEALKTCLEDKSKAESFCQQLAGQDQSQDYIEHPA